MNLAFKPNDIKKHIIETKTNTHFESINETKSATLFNITLTHIETNISVNTSGYNKLDTMYNCLNLLNNRILAKQFDEDIPSQNIVSEFKEFNTVCK